MKVAAQELASEGITFNVVSPGIVYAGLTKGIYDPVMSDIASGRTIPFPQGRLCSAEELAGTIFAFLASDGCGLHQAGTTVTI